MKPSEIIEFEETSCHQKNESTICSVIVFCKDLKTGCFVSLKVILKWESQGRIANCKIHLEWTPKMLWKKLTPFTKRPFLVSSLYLYFWVLSHLLSSDLSSIFTHTFLSELLLVLELILNFATWGFLKGEFLGTPLVYRDKNIKAKHGC